MTTEEDPSPDERGRVYAMHLQSLVPGSSTAFAESTRTLDIATQLQGVGWQAPLAEFQATMKGVPRGLGHALLSRIAATGEQLSLAWTALSDARRWLQPGVDASTAAMGGRALAETAGYFMIAAGHGLANATLRVLLLNENAREAAGGISGIIVGDPFTTETRGWISLERDAARKLRRYARAAGGDDALRLAEAVGELAKDPAWRELIDTRRRDFHQLRPQSVSGGVNPHNPWKPNGKEGSVVLRVTTRPTMEPIPAADAIAIADAALEAITTAAETWLEVWPYAQADVGVPMHKLDRDPDAPPLGT
ncbi:hypothetical protein ABCS02_28125 [Microbacterium sp. X-17]|uniref:hypothetical protein n=1 Tax=Microbacterium sp. X-17 TaxID=3144404 RepID=UPI0031F57C9F